MKRHSGKHGRYCFKVALMKEKKGSLESTGYPNGLPHWGTCLGGCRNYDQTICRSILLSRRCQPGLPN